MFRECSEIVWWGGAGQSEGGLKKFQAVQRGGQKSLRIQRGGYKKFTPISASKKIIAPLINSFDRPYVHRMWNMTWQISRFTWTLELKSDLVVYYNQQIKALIYLCLAESYSDLSSVSKQSSLKDTLSKNILCYIAIVYLELTWLP